MLSKDLDSGSGRFSFAKAMFKDKIGLRSKGASRGSGGGGGGALSKGLGETMRFAGGLASGSGLHDGHGHGTPDSIKEEYDSDDDDDLSLYRLAKSLLRSFGPILQEVVDQAIDIVEKLKKCVHSTRFVQEADSCAAFSSIRLTLPSRKFSSSSPSSASFSSSVRRGYSSRVSGCISAWNSSSCSD